MILGLLALSACKYENHQNDGGRPIKLISLPECHNAILIKLYENNQYEATVSSDITIYSNIKFSGYYLRGKKFILLLDIVGNEIKLNMVEDNENKQTWIRSDLSKEEATNSGWILSFQ